MFLFFRVLPFAVNKRLFINPVHCCVTSLTSAYHDDLPVTSLVLESEMLTRVVCNVCVSRRQRIKLLPTTSKTIRKQLSPYIDVGRKMNDLLTSPRYFSVSFVSFVELHFYSSYFRHSGPVARTPVNANRALNVAMLRPLGLPPACVGGAL